MASPSSVHILDLPPLKQLSENDLVELCAAYLECHPEGVPEDEILRWVESVEKTMADISVIQLVLQRKLLIMWSDEREDFILHAARSGDD